ncbi:MAG: glycosyltransferase [Geminicoccaceae bacterium]
MIRTARRPQPSPLHVVVARGFAADRVRRQPWHTADGLARGLAAHGHDVLLLTDQGDVPSAAGYRIERVEGGLGASELASTMSTTLAGRPVEWIWIIGGAAGLARLRPFAASAPVTFVMAAPRLRLREFLALGPRRLWEERALLALPLATAILPGWVLRRGFERSGADGLVYLSATARDRFAEAGLPAGPVLSPQIEAASVLPRPRRSEGPFTVAYFGPPLAARGADLAVEAFEIAVERGLRGRLRLLLRPDSGEASIERLLGRVRRSRHAALIDVLVGMLSEAELRRELAACDAFLLPFRLPISEVPLVVIEACLSGRPTVVLDAPGVGEVARRLGGIVAASPSELPDALLQAETRRAALPSSAAWTDWERAVGAVLESDLQRLARLRLLALVGVDGAGKTYLLRHLAARLDAAGIPHRHVWTRFRNYLSKPLLALTRLTGHNRKEEVNGVRVGYHRFAGRPWLAWPFLVLQTIDTLLDMALRYPRRGLVLGDRCAYDTLVDLAVDTGLDDVVFGRLGHFLVGRLPPPRRAVVIDRPVTAIAASRPDALADRNFARRRALYMRLAREFDLPVVSNDRPVGQVIDDILGAAAGSP